MSFEDLPHPLVEQILMLTEIPDSLAAASRPLSHLTRDTAFRCSWHAAHAPLEQPSPYSWRLVRNAKEPQAEALVVALLQKLLAPTRSPLLDSADQLLQAAVRADHDRVVWYLLHNTGIGVRSSRLASTLNWALQAGATTVAARLCDNAWPAPRVAPALPSPRTLHLLPAKSLAFVLRRLTPAKLLNERGGLVERTAGSAAHVAALLSVLHDLAARALATWLKPRILCRPYRQDTLRAICACQPDTLSKVSGASLQALGLSPAHTLHALTAVHACGWAGPLVDCGWAWVRDAAFCGHTALLAELLPQLGGCTRLVSKGERTHLTYARLAPAAASWPELVFAGWAGATVCPLADRNPLPVFGPGAPLKPPLGDWAGTLQVLLDHAPAAAGGAAPAAHRALIAIHRAAAARGERLPPAFTSAIVQPLLRYCRPSELGVALYAAVSAHALVGPGSALAILSALEAEEEALRRALPLALQAATLPVHATSDEVVARLPLVQALLRHAVRLGVTSGLATLRDTAVALDGDPRVAALFDAVCL